MCGTGVCVGRRTCVRVLLVLLVPWVDRCWSQVVVSVSLRQFIFLLLFRIHMPSFLPFPSLPSLLQTHRAKPPILWRGGH